VLAPKNRRSYREGDVALSARGVPFVYSTGNTDHGSTNGYSGRPVLRKPFKFEELVAILARFKLASVER
jgi:hypothetical protein